MSGPTGIVLIVPLLHYRVRYAINSLWVRPDLLGWWRKYSDGDATVTLVLPKDVDSFSADSAEQNVMSVPSVSLAPTFTGPAADSRTAAVHLFMVQAEFEAELDGDRPEMMSEDHPYWRQATEACKVGQPICDNAAYDFLRWLRAGSKQPWLGLLAEQARQYGRAGLRYADNREVMGYGPKWSQLFRSPQLRLEVADLELIGTRVAEQQPVPVASELLSDARFLDEGARTPDLKRAVITAAAACEVRTGEVMAERVSADRARLMQMALKATSSLVYILDEVLDASFGISLKTVDFDLWERVRKLMKQRNTVVHEGAEVDAAVFGYRPTQVAADLFEWLELNVPDARQCR